MTHSSIGAEQRRIAEDAFANRDDCVIVATSVLELGIDVGDLDRVIQIDSPATVSSFLQRMGRTGRRPGSTRNCLFLATEDESLIQAMGLVELWKRGYVEPIVPPPYPCHILAQQLMALVLQERGIGRRTWYEWVNGMPGFAHVSPSTREQIVQWMLSQKILWEDEGMLSFGKAGEEAYGRKNFLELVSVFLAPPLFSVRHGREELGSVDQSTFLGKTKGVACLAAGGEGLASDASRLAASGRVRRSGRRDGLVSVEGRRAGFALRSLSVDQGRSGIGGNELDLVAESL